MIETDFEYEELCKALENVKNVIVSAGTASGKTFYINKYLSENKSKYNKIFIAHFDREKHLLYGKTPNPTLDCILKKALLSSYSCHDGAYLSDDCYTDFESRLCENTLLVVENYDIAAPSPYMRHLAKLPCKLIVVSRCEMKNCGEQFLRIALENNDRIFHIKERITSLTAKQSELLRTLAAMLYYLRDDTVINSSKNGVFDINSVEFYLGNLADEVCALNELGLVDIHENGRISICRAVGEYVLEKLSPTLDNCPTFMYFCEKYCDFLINTSVKDIFGVINTEKNDSETFATRELLEVYTYFSLTDENSTLRIYNLLISYLIDTVGKNGFNNISEHLFLRNKDYMLSLLEKELSKAKSFEFLRSGESSMEADLDMIRVCVCCLRNLPYTMYKENETIIRIFTRVLENLYIKISGLSDDEADKRELFGKVINICYETFSFGYAITRDGKYSGFRDCADKHKVKFTSQIESDRQNAVSLNMGYSIETVMLYGAFQKHLDAYIEESAKTNVSNTSIILQKLNKQRLADFSEITKCLSVHFCRLKTGYDKFYGFLEEKYEKQKIYDAEIDSGFKKRLEDNKHYLVRGFDKATKIGAKNYAAEIMNTLKSTSNPFVYLRLIFDDTFPINNEVYMYLSLFGLSDFVSKTPKMPNKTRLLLIEYLVDIVFVGFSKVEHTKLCFDCINKLLKSVKQTEASHKRLSNIASAMYLESIFYCFEHNIPCDMTEELYIKCSEGSDVLKETSDEYFARILYSRLRKKEIECDMEKLFSAMRCIVYEYMTQKSDFSRKGFIQACIVVSDKIAARQMFDMLVSYDFSKSLTKEQSDEILCIFNE